MPRATLPKPNDLAQVIQIARELEANGFKAGAVQVSAEGWAVSWSKGEAPATVSTPYDAWKARDHG